MSFARTGSSYKQLETFMAARTAGLNRYAALSTPIGTIDITWLEAAAAYYKISPDPNTYVYSVNRIVVADVPNRNSDAFPTEELQRFHPIAGKEVYKTFEAKPLYYEHNQVPEDARGIIFKSFITTEGPYRVITNVVGADRRKDADLANAIATNKRPYFSMGCIADRIRCSWCLKTFAEPREFCTHMSKLGSVLNDKLIYEILLDVCYVEESSVGDPAALIAGKENYVLESGKAIPSSGRI
jgi:hypothetical protein